MHTLYFSLHLLDVFTMISDSIPNTFQHDCNTQYNDIKSIKIQYSIYFRSIEILSITLSADMRYFQLVHKLIWNLLKLINS